MKLDKTTRLIQLGELSSRKRGEVAKWRKDLGSGKKTIGDLFDVDPPCIDDLTMLDIVGLVRQWKRGRIAMLNELAVEAGLNLATPYKDSDEETREWVRHAVLNGIASIPRPKEVEPEPTTEGGYWSDAQWLDGRGLADWLQTIIPTGEWTARLGEGNARTIRRAATEPPHVLSVWKVDRIMVHLGRHVSDVPEYLWVAHPRQARREPYAKEVRTAAVEAVSECGEIRKVARDMGIAPSTIHKWVHEEAA